MDIDRRFFIIENANKQLNTESDLVQCELFVVTLITIAISFTCDLQVLCFIKIHEKQQQSLRYYSKRGVNSIVYKILNVSCDVR